MPSLRLFALPAAVSIAALVAASAIGGELDDRPHASAATASAAADIPEPAERRVTTTTTVPPPPTTVVPEPVPVEPPLAPTAAPTRVAAPPAPPAPAAAPAPPPTATHDPGAEARALQLINQERTSAGLPGLRANAGAAGVARRWSTHMAATSLAHNPNLASDLAEADVSWTTCGENVGHAADPDRVHALFMGSGGHRANILSSAFTQVGVGVVSTGGHVWVTLDFVDG